MKLARVGQITVIVTLRSTSTCILLFCILFVCILFLPLMFVTYFKIQNVHHITLQKFSAFGSCLLYFVKQAFHSFTRGLQKSLKLRMLSILHHKDLSLVLNRQC